MYTSDTAGPPSSGSMSSSLLERLKARDPEAWRQLAEIYEPLIYYWCRRYELGPQDAADVVQEVFSAVLAGIGGFRRDRGRFRGWLWTITRNKIQDHFRANAGREAAAGGTEAQQRIAEIPEQLIEEPADAGDRGALGSLFQRALESVRAEFEDKTWEAFWRVTVLRQETGEVAASLDLSPAAVRIAKSCVLRRLRAVLGDLIE